MIFLAAISFLVNITLCFFIRRNDYSFRARFLFFSLGALLPAQAALGMWAFEPPAASARLIVGLYGAVMILASLALTDLGFTFLRISAHFSVFSLSRWKISRLALMEIAAAGAAIVSLAVPVFAFVPSGGMVGVMLTGWGIAACAISFGLVVVALYKLEVAYAAAPAPLRANARFYFLGIGAIGVFALLFLTRLLLFRRLTLSYVNAQAVVNLLAFPATLISILRCRLGGEKVVVPPGAVFTSLTLLFSGTFLVTLFFAIAGAQMLGSGFSQFETFAVIFSACFGTILLLASESVRWRLTRFICAHLRPASYDYRRLFCRFSEALAGAGDMRASVNTLVHALTSAGLLAHCRVYALNRQDGRYREILPLRYSRLDGGSFLAQGELCQRLAGGARMLRGDELRDFLHSFSASEDAKLLSSLQADLVMAVGHADEAEAVLAARCGKAALEQEDVEVLRAFAGALANVILQYRSIQERGDRARVEFFSQFSSFVAHEIKNQTATLSLITRNAAQHIGNPAFQKSLLTSLKSCADALQSLIFRLGAPPRPESLSCEPVQVNGVIREALESSGLPSIPGITVEVESRPAAKVFADRKSLFYIIRNLLINAIDAMHNTGRLSVRIGTADALPKDLARFFRLPPSLHPGRYLYITVADTGDGMDAQFVREKLFRAFTSTKEQGFGVGLYQSKLLVESMQGRIQCASEKGRGTCFCVFLPLA